MKKSSIKILKNNKMKMVLIFSFLMTVAVSFSATGGAKYIGALITVMEDFFSDGKKMATAFGILMAAIMGIRAIASQNSMSFMENLMSSAYILAIIAVVATILVAIGGATLEKEYVDNGNQKIVIRHIKNEG